MTAAPAQRRPGRKRRIAAAVLVAGLAGFSHGLAPSGSAAAPAGSSSAAAAPAAGVSAPARPAAAGALTAAAAGVSAGVAQGGAGGPATAVTTAARRPAQPGQPGGLCSVPGIGDIGSLINLCQLGSSGLIGDLNNVCQPSLPDPESANGGLNSLISPPASGKQPSTLYNSYGVAGQYWAATNLQCSDMTSLIGNNLADTVFGIAKAIDRLTITVYQAAAGESILSWLTSVVDRLISALGNAIYFPYLAPVVIIGTMWLAWQGLIRRRATRSIEGTIWMVIACAAAIWLIGRPADFTGMGSGVSNGMTAALNTAFSKLPATSQSSCLPVTGKDPQVRPGSFTGGPGSAVVAQNANDLWTVLVCKPWLAGEFGTTAYSAAGQPPTPVNTYGRQLLWSQAIASNEKPTSSLIQTKQATYAGIAASMQQRDPSVYPLFQGKQWSTRLEIGFAALFAAAIAGVLVLLISVTLILLKLGFLLLLITGPFFLLIGTHPGYGRVIAVRWFELLVGVLLKQAAVALVLSILLYAYSLIMGTSDAALPWALKILMIALVTVAVFIYRKPFAHLFSAVGYGMIGSQGRADVELDRGRGAMPASRLAAAAAALPALANYRELRLIRRSSAATAAGAGAGGGGGAGSGDGQAAADPDQASAGGSAAAGGAAARSGGRGAGAALRTRDALAATGGKARSAPPLKLPSRNGGGRAGTAARAGAARSSSAARSPGGAGSGRSGTAPARTTWPLRPGPTLGPSASPPASQPAAPVRPTPVRAPVRQRVVPPAPPPGSPARGRDTGNGAAPPRRK